MKKSMLVSILLFVSVTALLSVGYDHVFEGGISYSWIDLIGSIIVGTVVTLLLYSIGKRWKVIYDNKKP